MPYSLHITKNKNKTLLKPRKNQAGLQDISEGIDNPDKSIMHEYIIIMNLNQLFDTNLSVSISVSLLQLSL